MVNNENVFLELMEWRIKKINIIVLLAVIKAINYIAKKTSLILTGH